MTRISPILGFTVKIVGRTGASLKSQFPLYSLWDGNKYSREECIPCEQGTKEAPPCTKKSIVYENFCVRCNPSAKGKEEVKELNSEVPSIYVGESSRSLMERTREHWGAYRNGNSESHIRKHYLLHHDGEGDPEFVFKVVSQHSTALARQTREAVRIRRRGGGGLHPKIKSGIQ